MVAPDLEAASRSGGMISIALGLWRDGLLPVPLADGRKVPPPGFALKLWLGSDPCEPDIASAFQGRRGIGVALGDPSGGLTCRDFDKSGDYESWRNYYRRLASICPTVITTRGAHVYFYTTSNEVASYCRRGSSGAIVTLADGRGEIRRGGYCVYPPSRHPSGTAYRFTIPMDDPPFIDDLAEAGLVDPNLFTGTTSKKYPALGVQGGSAIACVPPKDVDAIVRQNLPTRPGERNRRLFGLIRGLRAHPETRDADPRELRAIVQEWHRLAYRRIRTKHFGPTWIDFVVGWPRCRVPAGATIAAIASEARGDRIEWLADLCRLLQERAGDDAFFLDCRTAAQFAGVGRSTASRWLRSLRADGRLALVRPGNRREHRANEYRYLGPLIGREIPKTDMSAF